MMSEAEVRKIVDENIRPLREALQLHGWFFRLRYSTSTGKNRATCASDPQRHEATITFNPGELVDEKDVLNVLLHELLHVYHAEFYLYWEAVKASVSGEVFDAMQPSYDNACEHLVEQVLCFFEHTLRTTPKKLIAAVRRREN